jgi:hypothetical protein
MKSQQPSALTLSVCACLIITLFSSAPVMASHTAGAEITYLHLSGSVYRFNCTYYRDCFGIPSPAFFIMNEHSVSCGVNHNDTLYPIAGTGLEIPSLRAE